MHRHLRSTGLSELASDTLSETLPNPANVRHREATTPNEKRASDPTKVGAEARCMSYAIEAGRRRLEAPFTKARRQCRNSPNYKISLHI